jgi:hypothetical protein
MKTKKSKKNIKRKTYKGGMPRVLRPRKTTQPHPYQYAEEGAAVEPRIFLRQVELDTIRSLIISIDAFLHELGIVQEFYGVGVNTMIYLRFAEEDSYFYYTSFTLDESELPDPPELPRSVDATPPRFKNRLKRILQTNNTNLYIKATMCILNGLNFAYLIQCKLILTSLLHDIYVTKKDDDTNASQENSLRNFNFLLGFWFVDMTAGIQYPTDNEYDEEVEKRIQALRDTPPAKAAAASAEMDSEGSDYSPSETEESESEDGSFVEDPGPDATVVTTDSDKWVFNINTLNLAEKMLESVILPKSYSRWEVISKGDYLQDIQDKRTRGKGLPWSFLSPSELSGMETVTPIGSLDECFDYLQGTTDSKETTSGGKKKKRKYSRKIKR